MRSTSASTDWCTTSGSKDELIDRADSRRRPADRRAETLAASLARVADDRVVRQVVKWMTASRANLALVRLNYEAAALDTSVTGLAGDVRADQIGVWRHDVEQRLLGEV